MKLITMGIIHANRKNLIKHKITPFTLLIKNATFSFDESRRNYSVLQI